MGGILIKLLVGALMNLMTESFFEKMVLLALHWLGKKYKSDAELSAGKAMADAWGQSGYWLSLG